MPDIVIALAEVCGFISAADCWGSFATGACALGSAAFSVDGSVLFSVGAKAA
ncbi:MAG TPA: hypothetical protein VLZ11_09385 [Flavobacterium sp.]|nr:hypothetical protein [Flavobacterium sp.]